MIPHTVESEVHAPEVPTKPTPAWDSLPEDIPCPRCGYNLRMLTHARCPECGLEFVWQEVIASAKSIATCPSFEYQARCRPVRSFLWTTRRLMLPPWRLWRELPTAGPVRPFRLLLFAVLNFLLVELTFVIGWWLTAYVLMPWARWHVVFARSGKVSDALLLIAKDMLAPLRNGAANAPAAFIVAVAPAVLTWLGLMLFWQTRAKHQVRPALALRLACYSWIAMLWGYVLAAVVSMFVRVAVTWHGSSALTYWVARFPLHAIDFATLGAVVGLFGCLAYGLGQHLPARQAGAIVGSILMLEALLVLVTLVTAAIAFDSWWNPVTMAIRWLCSMLAEPFLAAW